MPDQVYPDKISVIVPVFNLFGLIGECIESLLSQTYRNLEIIFIDDGSSDNTFDVIKSYQDKDDRIVLKKIKNSGVTNARYQGYKISTANYIMFVDGDDTIPKSAIYDLFSGFKGKNVDLILGGFNVVYPNKNIVNKLDAEVIDSITYARRMILGELMGSPCMKIYKKELFTDRSFSFDETLVRGEDLLMNLEICSRINKIFISSKIVYNYKIREGSAMTTFVSTLSYEKKYRNAVRKIIFDNSFSSKEVLDDLELADLNAYLYAMYSNIIYGSPSKNNAIKQHIVDYYSSTAVRRRLCFKFKFFYYLVIKLNFPISCVVDFYRKLRF